MSYILKLVVFAVLSVLYWLLLLFYVAAFTYASICNYPDAPGCRTNLLPVLMLFVGGLAVYCVVFWRFARWIRRHREGYRR